MHRYIEYSKLREFDGVDKMTVDDVITDLQKYEIKGYMDDDLEESEYYIADALYADMIQRRSNYKAYIETGLTARMLMELRFNSLLLFDGFDDYFSEHAYLDTPEQVIEHRIKWCKKHVNSDYNNDGWQNMLLVRILWRERAADIEIDYEPCYEDARYMHTKTLDDYVHDWYEAIKPPIVDGWIDWDNVPVISDDLYDYLHKTVDEKKG